MRKKDIKKITIILGITILFLILVFLINILITKFFSARTLTEQELNIIVGKMVLLEQNDKPTVLLVEDPTKLASNAFFLKAQKGDYFTVFEKSKMAILYRPSVKKIVNVSGLK